MSSSTAYWFLFLFMIVCADVETKNGPEGGLYDGAQVWKVELLTDEDVSLIQELANRDDISLWRLTPRETLFLVEMDKKLRVHGKLSNQHLDHVVVIMDVQRRVDEQKIEPPRWDHNALRSGHRMNWHRYPTVEVVNEYMNYLTKQYPSVCKQKVIGKSAENISIKMLTISNGNPANKAMFLVAGQHAREWIAITSALYIMREIATKFDNQPHCVQRLDWHVIPLLNPDGFRYTYEHDRLWRKNRSKNYDTHCKGVDLNRNFGKHWNITGVTEINPCRGDYGGPNAFSEPETIALRKTVENLKSRVMAMVDFHSFGQMILYPWSGRASASKHNSLLKSTAKKMRAAISEFKGEKYSCGQTFHEIYPASGSLLDWAHSVGITHSYVIEGRDMGESGFLLPPMYIQEAGHEMLTTVNRLARVIDEKSKPAQPRSWF